MLDEHRLAGARRPQDHRDHPLGDAELEALLAEADAVTLAAQTRSVEVGEDEAPQRGKPLAAGLTAPGYADTTVVNGTSYYYVVAAFDGVRASAESAAVEATLPSRRRRQ